MASTLIDAALKAFLDSKVSDAWKMALYTDAATLDENTSTYTTTDEVPNGNGYTTGGVTLTGATSNAGSGTAWLDFDDATFGPNATFTARYALIYDSSDGDAAYAVVDFGSNKTGQGGNFIVRMPTPDANNAIIRI